MEEVRSDSLLLTDYVQFLWELKAVGEHHSNSRIPMNISLISDTVAAECLFGKIHNLLRCTTTLYRHCGEHKNGFTALEAFSQSWCLVSIFELVNRSHWRLGVSKCLSCALNLIIAEGEAGAGDQPVVGNLVARLHLESVVCRVYILDGLVTELEALHHDVFLFAHDILPLLPLSLLTIWVCIRLITYALPMTPPPTIVKDGW